MAPLNETGVRFPVGRAGSVGTGAGSPSEILFSGASGVAARLKRLTNGGFRSAIELAIIFGTKLTPYPPRSTVPFVSVAAKPKRGAKFTQSASTPAEVDTPFCPAMIIFLCPRSTFDMRLATSELGP